jgi:hypothetical protein
MTQTPDIRSGVLRAFDSTSYTATVQLTGSLQGYVASIPTARDIASSEMTNGRKVAVLFFDPTNNADAVLFAVWS